MDTLPRNGLCAPRRDLFGTEIALNWPGADAHDAGDYQRLVKLVEDAAVVLTRVGDVTAAAVLSGVEVSDWSPPWQSKLLEAASTSSSRLEALSQAAISAARMLAMVEVGISRPALTALKAIADVLLDPIATDAAWAMRDGADAVIEAVRVEAARVARHKDIHSALTGVWRPEVMALPLKEIQAQWINAQSRRSPRVLFQRGIAADGGCDIRISSRDLGTELVDWSNSNKSRMLSIWQAKTCQQFWVLAGAGWRPTLAASKAASIGRDGFAWPRPCTPRIPRLCWHCGST